MHGARRGKRFTVAPRSFFLRMEFFLLIFTDFFPHFSIYVSSLPDSPHIKQLGI